MFGIWLQWLCHSFGIPDWKSKPAYVYSRHRSLTITSEQEQAKEAAEAKNFTTLNYVLDNLRRLPKRTDKHVLNDEQDLVRQRYRLWIQYIMTGGTCEEELSLVDEKELDTVFERLDGKSPLRI